MTFKTRASTDYIVVHAAATSPSMDVDAHEIGRWHRAKGWLAIGYNMVITRAGVWETGRPMEAQGAHVRGYNARAIGICMPGGIAERPATEQDDKAVQARGYVPLPGEYECNFTEEQLAALAQMLIMLRQHYPSARIVGHSDLDSRKPHCPGFDVAEFCEKHGLNFNPQ